MKYFAWTNSVYEAFSKTFPGDYSDEALHFFHKCIEDEFYRSVKCKDEQSLEKLFKCLADFFQHFVWKINWQKNERSLMRSCCATTLSHLIQVGVALGGGKSSSKWMDSILTVINVFPGPLELLCDAFFLVCNVKECFRSSFKELLKHFLFARKLTVSGTAHYFKVMLLLRRLKFLEESRSERAKVAALALRIPVPAESLSWLVSHGVGNLVDMDEKNFPKKFLSKRLPPKFFKKLREVIMEVSVQSKEHLSPGIFVIDAGGELIDRSLDKEQAKLTGKSVDQLADKRLLRKLGESPLSFRQDPNNLLAEEKLDSHSDSFCIDTGDHSETIIYPSALFMGDNHETHVDYSNKQCYSKDLLYSCSKSEDSQLKDQCQKEGDLKADFGNPVTKVVIQDELTAAGHNLLNNSSEQVPLNDLETCPPDQVLSTAYNALPLLQEHEEKHIEEELHYDWTGSLKTKKVSFNIIAESQYSDTNNELNAGKSSLINEEGNDSAGVEIERIIARKPLSETRNAFSYASQRNENVALSAASDVKKDDVKSPAVLGSYIENVLNKIVDEVVCRVNNDDRNGFCRSSKNANFSALYCDYPSFFAMSKKVSMDCSRECSSLPSKDNLLNYRDISAEVLDATSSELCPVNEKILPEDCYFSEDDKPFLSEKVQLDLSLHADVPNKSEKLEEDFLADLPVVLGKSCDQKNVSDFVNNTEGGSTEKSVVNSIVGHITQDSEEIVANQLSHGTTDLEVDGIKISEIKIPDSDQILWKEPKVHLKKLKNSVKVDKKKSVECNIQRTDEAASQSNPCHNSFQSVESKPPSDVPSLERNEPVKHTLAQSSSYVTRTLRPRKDMKRPRNDSGDLTSSLSHMTLDSPSKKKPLKSVLPTQQQQTSSTNDLIKRGYCLRSRKVLQPAKFELQKKKNVS